MKKRFFVHRACLTIITLCLLVSTAMSKSANEPIKIFLLGGQSNMAGIGKVTNLKSPYNKTFSKVQIWSGKWVALSSIVSNKKGSFGPEISFGHAIADVLPNEDVRLLKYAIGGTALYDDWSPKTKGKQYVDFMKMAKAALADLDAQNLKYKISGMLWLQGESDANENRAESYEKNLTAFIAHMRMEFKTPEMPFIIARVLSHYGGRTGQAKIVREAQEKLARSVKNVAWFDTDDCSLVNRGHYNADGLIEIGKRFAKGYEKIANNMAIDINVKAFDQFPGLVNKLKTNDLAKVLTTLNRIISNKKIKEEEKKQAKKMITMITDFLTKKFDSIKIYLDKKPLYGIEKSNLYFKKYGSIKIVKQFKMEYNKIKISSEFNLKLKIHKELIKCQDIINSKKKKDTEKIFKTLQKYIDKNPDFSVSKLSAEYINKMN